MKKIYVVLSVGLVSVFSCTKKNAQDEYPAVTCDINNVTFSGVVKPIMMDKCVGCHAGFSQYTAVAGAINSGKLLPAINHTGAHPMPKGQPKLDDCTISKITEWANNGLPDN